MTDRSAEQLPSIDSLLNGGSIAPPDSAAAFQHYVSKHGLPDSNGSARRPLWIGVAAACAMLALFSFAPARGWGQHILSMLRVQKVAVVPVDLEAISAAGNGHDKLLAQMISDRVVVTMKPGDPTPVDSAASASSSAGFSVKTLDGLGTPSRILVRDESAFHVQLDRERILAVLEAAGRSDITVPADVDGAEIAVHIPKAVDMVYGECTTSNRQGCIHFTQVPSPAISIPPSLNMAGLAEAALEVTGMSASEAQAFCQTVDWSSTLVIPVPRNGSSTQTVPVDGVNGTLVQTSGRRGGEYALIWVKNREIFAITGSGSPDGALAVAESLN